MTALLIIIYIAFISLGLPDSVLGSAWPVMQTEFGAPLSLAGYVAMVTAAGTIVSSLASNRLISRFGVGKVTAVSVLMTAAGLLSVALTPNAWLLFLWAVPLGLGGGTKGRENPVERRPDFRLGSIGNSKAAFLRFHGSIV